jgi:hypothetical protein
MKSSNRRQKPLVATISFAIEQSTILSIITRTSRNVILRFVKMSSVLIMCAHLMSRIGLTLIGISHVSLRVEYCRHLEFQEFLMLPMD